MYATIVLVIEVGRILRLPVEISGGRLKYTIDGTTIYGCMSRSHLVLLKVLRGDRVVVSMVTMTKGEGGVDRISI